MSPLLLPERGSERCIFLLDKPPGWSSFDLVKYVKKLTGLKTGHAGTLDPLATGLMILCCGKWTRYCDAFRDMPKAYSGTICIGATTPGFDREKEEDTTFGCAGITPDDLHEAARKLTGNLHQLPPVFSAKKIGGKTAYNLARSGQEVALKTQPVVVYEFSVFDFRTEGDRAFVDFFIRCSKGTYIRALARDLGELLSNGAYLWSLRREEIGPYRVDTALTLDELRILFPPKLKPQPPR